LFLPGKGIDQAGLADIGSAGKSDFGQIGGR